MNKKPFLFLIAFLGFSFLASPIIAQEEIVEINFFYSDFCSHCAKEEAFLDILEGQYHNLVINRYSITSNKEAPTILASFYEEYEVPERNWGLVPALFIGDEYFIGYNEEIKAKIIERINGYSETDTDIYEINIPFLGTVNTSEMSLTTLTIVLGLLDGFNPCAMWILLFLIALLISTNSRKKMLLIGGTFLFASGLVYYLILNAWLKLFLAVSYINIVRIIMGVSALGIGVWQIKNFIDYKPGVCEVTGGEGGIQTKLRNKIENKAKQITEASIGIGMIVGVFVLAIGVNMIEFFCSAGIPAIFTQILSLNVDSGFQYQFYVLLYTFIFMLDDLVIFLITFFTLKQFGFTHEYNHWATLIGGLLIFVLGILLIFKPEILSFA